MLWPVDDSDERVPIEMSGLPVFDRDRQFAGYRGFGICRVIERTPRPVAPAEHWFMSASRRPLSRPRRKPRTGKPRPEVPGQQAAPQAKVLAFRAPPSPEPPAPTTSPEPAPSLSPGEHSAFEELARELNARLKNARGKSAAPDASDDFAVEPFVVPPSEPLEPAAQESSQQDSSRHNTRRKKAPRATPTAAAPSSTACRSAFWSIASKI